MPELGFLFFLLIVAGLIALYATLGRRYGRGRQREVEDVTRETSLRDVNIGWTGGFLPYPGNRDPSPRERLRKPPDPQD